MKFDNGEMQITFLARNELERRVVEHFRKGIAKIRWDAQKEKALILPAIFKIKQMDIIFSIIEQREERRFAYEQLLRFFLEGKLLIGWNGKDFSAYPSLIELVDRYGLR